MENPNEWMKLKKQKLKDWYTKLRKFSGIITNIMKFQWRPKWSFSYVQTRGEIAVAVSS